MPGSGSSEGPSKRTNVPDSGHLRCLPLGDPQVVVCVPERFDSVRPNRDTGMTEVIITEHPAALTRAKKLLMV